MLSEKRGFMDTKQTKLNAYLLLYTLVAAVAVTLRSIASFTRLNPYGYYRGTLCAVASYIVLGGCLLLFSYTLLHKKDEPKRAVFGSALTCIPGAPLAICLMLLGVSLWRQPADGKIASVLIPLIAILTIGGAFYFLFAVLYEFKICDLRAAFCMVCTLSLILYAGYLYFDTTLAINATTKIIDQMAFIFSAIFFLYETRISLGRENWSLYTAIGFIASLLCAYSAIPSLLVYVFDGRVISNRIEESFVTFFLFAYILCRTVLSLLLKGESASPLMAALHEEAKKQADAVASNGPLPFEPTPKVVSTPAEDMPAEEARLSEEAEPTEPSADEEKIIQSEESGEENTAYAQEDKE